MPKVFEISDENQEKIKEWLKNTVYPEVIEKQKQSFKNNSDKFPADHMESIATSWWDKGLPWGGAIGGGLTYSFTNTTIGQVQKVKYGDHELDLSDYNSW